MEPFKFSIDVNINLQSELAEVLKQFIKVQSAPAAPAPAAPAPAAPAAPAPAAPEISINEVRKVLAEKVNEHRTEIKDKLTELGAPSVTKLDKSKYQEMLNFLNSL